MKGFQGLGEKLTDIISTLPFDFYIDKHIDHGGQKNVFVGKDPASQEKYVLKIIKTTSDSKERTLREIRAAKLIDHERVPKITLTNIDDSESNDDLIWILEPYIAGDNFRDWLQRNNDIKIEEVVFFIESMLDILEKCTTEKIIHRDIKPENIIIDEKGDFWLIDFGISRHLDLESITKTDSPFGPCTIGYSASELFRNRKREIDIRADLFSIGVIAAEMVCGYNPFIHETQDILQVIKNIENQPLPMLKIEGDENFLLAKFIKMLGDNRISRRPRSVSEAKDILEIVKKSIR